MVYIYKIYCKDKDIEDVYIGSTNNITRRMYQHKQCCYNENQKEYNKYKYTFIRENGNWSNWTYEIICQCTSEDRYKMERWYMENTANTNLNKQIPSRTVKEYYKEYNQLNKKKIKEYQKDWCDVNKDKIKEQKKQYRELHKAKISEQKNKKYDCECGGKYTHVHKNQHLKSKKHELFISSMEVVVKT